MTDFNGIQIRLTSVGRFKAVSAGSVLSVEGGIGEGSETARHSLVLEADQALVCPESKREAPEDIHA